MSKYKMCPKCGSIVSETCETCRIDKLEGKIYCTRCMQYLKPESFAPRNRKKKSCSCSKCETERVRYYNAKAIFNIEKDYGLPSKEFLASRTVKECCKELHVSPMTISAWRDYYGIGYKVNKKNNVSPIKKKIDTRKMIYCSRCMQYLNYNKFAPAKWDRNSAYCTKCESDRIRFYNEKARIKYEAKQ